MTTLRAYQADMACAIAICVVTSVIGQPVPGLEPKSCDLLRFVPAD